MTGFNNDNKFVPSTPKTFQVLELKDQQQEQQQPVKKSPLSAAARAKVVNKSGSNYVSESQEDYGPCSYSGCPYPGINFDIYLTIEGNRRKWARRPNQATWLRGTWEYGTFTSHYLSSWKLWLGNIDEARRAVPLLVDDTIYAVNLWGAHCEEDSKFCNCALEVVRKSIREHENGGEVYVKEQIDSDISKWSRYIFKTAAVVTATAVNPVATAVTGAALWGAGEALEHHPDANEYDKGIFRSISGFGGDMFKSGATGKIVGDLTSAWPSDVQRVYKISENVNTVKDSFLDLAYHQSHTERGLSYDSDCEVCKK
jgi:hypothetical protein